MYGFFLNEKQTRCIESFFEDSFLYLNFVKQKHFPGDIHRFANCWALISLDKLTRELETFKGKCLMQKYLLKHQLISSFEFFLN